MTKLRSELLRLLQSLQLHFDIKASMVEDDDSPQQPEPSTPTNTVSTYFFDSFTQFVERVIIKPFGERLSAALVELVTELDLPDWLVTELKKKTENQGPSQRKHLRKPMTPTKVIRNSVKAQKNQHKTFETKEIQTEMIAL